MEFTVIARSSKTKKYVELMATDLIKQLKLTNCRKFLLIDISKNGPGNNNEGITMPMVGLGSIVVAIKPTSYEKLGITLAHEMVHVKQIAKGQLKTSGTKKVWLGKKYSNKSKYLYLPWEVEAFAKQELLFRRALDKISGIDTK